MHFLQGALLRRDHSIGSGPSAEASLGGAHGNTPSGPRHYCFLAGFVDWVIGPLGLQHDLRHDPRWTFLFA